MFDLPTKKIINSVKITLHWGKTNIHREQGRLPNDSQTSMMLPSILAKYDHFLCHKT